VTANQYRAALAKLGLSQRKAGPFFGVNERTSRRWAEDGPPEAVAKLLRLMVRLDLSPDEVK
jgi:hypothetical protein